MKKITVLILSSIIALSPLFNIGDFSYADTQPSWVYVTQQDDAEERALVVGAVKAYLGARGYNNIFTYTAEKAIVQWSYNNWDNLARSKGYNGLTDLNNHIAYRYNNNDVLQFFLDDSSIEMMNQMYSAILEYYNISENTNKQIYNGEWFEDNDGNGCYVFVLKNDSPLYSKFTYNTNYFESLGTKYRYDYFDLVNLESWDNHITNDLTVKMFSSTGQTWENIPPINQNTLYKYFEISTQQNFSRGIALSINTTSPNDPNNIVTNSSYGVQAIIKQNDNYYIGNYQELTIDNTNGYNYSASRQINNLSALNAAISAAQAGMNAGIVAAGKAAAISTGKEGVNALKDYLEDNDATDDDVVTPVDDPTTPPDDIPSGGSPSGYNPTGGVLTPDGNGGFNFNFKMPQLNINWNLNLNTNNLPFPFSIPSDFYKAFQAIDVEPEAPSFSKVIHLGFGNKWSYNWNFECDFSEIDGAETLANIHRKWFLFVYIVMLIIATRSVMHIY